MKFTRWYCAKCRKSEITSGNAADYSPFTYGVCERCLGSLRGKFEEVGELSWDTRRELEREYGVDSVEEAYVYRHFGRPSKKEVWYKCDTCGTTMYECVNPYRSSEVNGRGVREDVVAHQCASCSRTVEERVRRLNDESHREQKRLRRKLFE